MSVAPVSFPVPVRWSPEERAVVLLDQALLPGEERYLRLMTLGAVAEAITSLRVRGAPAIGIAAAMGLVVGATRRLEEMRSAPSDSLAEERELEEGFDRDRALLLATRPTAVNLSWAIGRMSRVFEATAGRGARSRVQSLLAEAEAIAGEDREMCRLIGDYGLEVIPREGARLLTHCNAGALATGGRGTALAPVYGARARGIPVKVYADETRPLLQGARLTAWELQRAGVDVTVIGDAMAAALMARGKVDLVVVGADRIAANGDTANKIGTYGLAVLARHHGIPFYIAAPRTTFDLYLPHGHAIPIEERDPLEISVVGGRRVVPDGVPSWNPAFDITPAHLVTAFITDGGLLRPPFGASISGLDDSRPPGVETESGAGKEGS